jgi:hypothetical protein
VTDLEAAEKVLPKLDASAPPMTSRSSNELAILLRRLLDLVDVLDQLTYGLPSEELDAGEGGQGEPDIDSLQPALGKVVQTVP